MAPGWQEIASQHVEQITGYVREALSTGLVYLKSELGIDLGLNPDLCAPWLLLLTVWVGLVLMLILWVSVCRSFSKRLSGTETEDTAENTGPVQPLKKAEEPKKRNRKRNSEKKAQRNGLAVEPQEDAKVVEGQELLEAKTDKGKKNKKKPKPPAKDKKSTTSADGKEHDEGTWETKVSNREKRQQRRKDKTPGDGSGSPGPTAVSSAVTTTESAQNTPEEPEITTTAVSTPPVQREVEVDPPETEASFVRDPVIPQVTPCREEVLVVNGSGWSDLGLQLSPSIPPQMASVQDESWTSMTVPAEPFVFSQDMEGSWTFVDGSQISASFGAVAAVPDSSCGAQPAMTGDDEWSGLNLTSEDPLCDWNAPSVEWGNYVEQPVKAAPPEPPIPEVPQESDNEKDKEEAGAPGSGKAKKKKKKKKKVEDAGPSAQPPVRTEIAATPAQSSTPNISSATAGPLGDDAARGAASTPLQTQQRMSGPEPTDKPTAGSIQKKTDDPLETLKPPVKKKKARRET